MGGEQVADDTDTCLGQNLARTLVLIGCSGNGKSATGNSILGRDAFESKSRAEAVTKECELQTTMRPNGQIINVIDTPGLFSLSPSDESIIQEILKCFHLAKEGINAVLMVFSVKNRLTVEEESALSVLKMLFENEIAEYMIVVFTNEDSLEDDGETINDYLKDCSDFKDILMACNNRMVPLDNRRTACKRKKAIQVQNLLNLVEEVVRKNKGKTVIMDIDLSHAELGEKLEKIKALKGQPKMSNSKEGTENSSPHDQLIKRVEKVEETASSLEQKLNEERTARLDAEERAKNQETEVEKLREKLKNVEKELAGKGGCSIL